MDNADDFRLDLVFGDIDLEVTTKWLTINETLGKRSLVVEQAHAKYGAVVRLAPNELSFSDRVCVKELYLAGSKFPKSRRYEGFASTTRASFDMTKVHEHRIRRNLVRHVLAQSHIDEAEPLISDQVRKALPWIKHSSGSSLDVMLWMRRVMLDTAGGLFLGRSFGALEDDTPPAFLDDLDDYFAITALRWLAPWILGVLQILPVVPIQRFLQAQHRCYLYGRKAFDEYIEQHGRYSGRIDLLTKMVGSKGYQRMTDEEISNELGSLLVGATDTTVVVSTWMLWELAQRPEWQRELRTELRDNKVAFSNGVPPYKEIKSLPILDGFVLECMRLHPAQSIGLPRIACTNAASIGGIVIPQGTYVSVPSREVHADPEVYPSPHSFLPERWINARSAAADFASADQNAKTSSSQPSVTPSNHFKTMQSSLLIWSKGSRACLGQYVATMELKFVLASLVNGWNVELDEDTKGKSGNGRGRGECMEQTDYFLAFPRGRKCGIVFTPAME
ncbi:uncharacterized protein KY384_003408 [Bacidia gigantensis]|uniref:uncharacterized protein n=1 Tax=Bacidia gigantensis TaxID=2732470 RepID=UPI001D0527B9|nr:uncharacterized protein KY384_003408 [Bacidia gigantensis]KAG8531772.1 hypothetical protein KY384_003408 [Bacidia gigantensis]